MNSIKNPARPKGRGVIIANRAPTASAGPPAMSVPAERRELFETPTIFSMESFFMSVLPERRELFDCVAGAENLAVLLQILLARGSDVFGSAEFREGGEHPAEDAGVGIF